VTTLAHFCHRPLAYIVVPKNLSQGGGSEIDSAASTGRKTPRERKLSGRQKSTEEIPSQRGEIVAIVIAIELDFIGINIFIIIITITFITTITTPSRCNIFGLNLVQFLEETFPVLITLVVDAIEWNH
jgi:hypothetical protein